MKTGKELRKNIFFSNFVENQLTDNEIVLYVSSVLWSYTAFLFKESIKVRFADLRITIPMEKTMVLYEAMHDERFPADELVLLPLEGEPNCDLPIPFLSFGDDEEEDDEEDMEEEDDFDDLDDDLNDDFDDDDDDDDYDDDEDDYEDDYEDDDDYDDFDE
jgi:phosphopantothenoylcysteine synthetase/decarboxylase